MLLILYNMILRNNIDLTLWKDICYQDDWIEDLKDIIKSNLIGIFDIDDLSKLESFEEYILNKDHWFEHSFNVYNKALEISYILKQKWYDIDYIKIFIMSFMHDSWRFHINSNNPKKRQKCERKHNKCAIWQIRLAKSKLSKRWIEFDKKFWDEIFDYLDNHDFLNDRLDPNYREPENIEWQIVRLSDRISTDIETEIDRYWETWKRLKTPYFIKDISFEDRINFDFTKIGDYIKWNKFDEFTFFLALISISENDFSNKDLKELYKKWSNSKNLAINKILLIWKLEWYSDSDLEKMKKLIDDYIKHFNIKF